MLKRLLALMKYTKGYVMRIAVMFLQAVKQQKLVPPEILGRIEGIEEVNFHGGDKFGVALGTMVASLVALLGYTNPEALKNLCQMLLEILVNELELHNQCDPVFGSRSYSDSECILRR